VGPPCSWSKENLGRPRVYTAQCGDIAPDVVRSGPRPSTWIVICHSAIGTDRKALRNSDCHCKSH
jgi:hypothetical protein